MISLAEVALGFSQGRVYYFTTLKDAANILKTGKLFTSTGRVAADNDDEEERPQPRHVSFTLNPDFADGYPWNSDYDQSHGKVNKDGSKKYDGKKHLIALVRFTVEVEKLANLVRQAVGQAQALPFNFPLRKPKKPEQEERLWLGLSKVTNFPECISSICFNGDLDSETSYLNQLAKQVFQEAKNLGIPIFVRDFKGRESELTNITYLYSRWGKGTNWVSGRDPNNDDKFGGKYESFVKVAAVCCLRKFSLKRQGILSYLSRFSQVLEGEDLHKFILDVESQTEEYLNNPDLLRNFGEPYSLKKAFEGDKNLQYILIQSVERACKEANVPRFGQLVTRRRHQIEAWRNGEGELSESFNFRNYLQNNWLLQESKES